MKNPIDEIEARIRETTVQKEKIRQELADLESELANLNRQAGEVAMDDDVESYLELKKERERIEAAVELKSYRLEHFHEVPGIDITDAWKEYARSYNKRFETAQRRAEEIKQTYLLAFRDLLVAQNEGMKERARVGRLVGLDPSSAVNNEEIKTRFPMRTIDRQAAGTPLAFKGQNYQPAMAFYLAENMNSKAVNVMAGLVPVKEAEI